MDNFSTEFSLECIKREIKTMSRDELEQRIYDFFKLAQKQSEHIAALNLLIKNLEEKCQLLLKILLIFNES